MRRLPLVLLTLLSAFQFVASASGQTSVCPSSNNIYCMPILSTEAVKVIPAGSAQPVVQKGFVPVTSAIGTQLSTLPTPTPTSGLIFAFGPGGLTTERELGPIFSDAPWTVGRHKWYLAFAYQFFEFDKIDDVSFQHLPLELRGCLANDLGTCGATPIQTNSQYSVKFNEYTAYASFGITDRVDISVAIPIVDVRSGITTTCSQCFQQIGTNITLVFMPNTAQGSSSGIGDMIIRMKDDIVKDERFGLAVGFDLRAPTGDSYNFRGAGAPGARPFVALGYRARFSPHLNVGFLVNGNSILASQDGVTRAQLPNSLDYSAGADFSVAKWLSLSGDLLGQTFFDAGTVAINASGLALHASTQTFNTNTVALGFKSIPIKRLLISGNVLIKVDNNGLHYKPSPMVGISYTF
jgi:hypothetical protein